MSYRTWITYGYGVKMSDINIVHATNDTIASFIHLAPDFEEKYIQWVEDTFREEGDPESIYEILPVNSLLEYEDEDTCYVGLMPIIKAVIEEVEGIPLIMCHDYDNEEFLLYAPAYPWELTKREKEMSQNEMKKVYEKYIGKLTNKKFNVDFYEVENGG